MRQQMIRLAGCVITDERGRVLLLHRNNGKHTHWEIPGGKIDRGESAEEAAIREIKEELDVDVVIERKFGEKEFKMEDSTQMHHTWYLAQIVSGKPRIAEPQTFDDLRYFYIEELTKIRDQLSHSAKNFLEVFERRSK
ncbi:MAG: NUDIX hydrolase [Candidatus Saccharimonadales bacterium]|jgi:mutator protein MutT